MRQLEPSIIARFADLARQGESVSTSGRSERGADSRAFFAWASCAEALLEGAFGRESAHLRRFHAVLAPIPAHYIESRHAEACLGVFLGAKADADGGYLFRLTAEVSGEVLGDFISLAKAALAEGHHTVACVLACASLEDALKRYANAQGIDTADSTMEQVINALKGKGLVSGPLKSLLSAMPKIRNSAMHADWESIGPQEAASVLGFTEQFLLSKF